MKSVKYIVATVLLLMTISGFSQNVIHGYEYWFDNDYSERVSQTVTPEVNFSLSTQIPTTGLVPGIHNFNFRAWDNGGMYSVVLSSFFYKLPQNSNTDREIVAYEYWFDNDYENAVAVYISGNQSVNIAELIPVQSIINGIHTLNIRFKDNSGLWSSVLSSFFYKIPHGAITERNITTYEYWLDNDYENKTTVTVAAQQHLNLNEMLDAEDIVSGIHTLNIRFKDDLGLWSSTLSQFFYKLVITETEIADNYITAYRYWLDADFENATYVQLAEPAKNFNLIENIDFTRTSKGNYEINFQFKDTLGLWSSVIADTIEKRAFPIADFSYTMNATCENTVVEFANNSIDSDTQWWDFGDGETCGETSPAHTYTKPGSYTVSLTVSDTATGKDSAKTVLVSIPEMDTHSSLEETVCDSYTAPDGQVYTETNPDIMAIIPNAAGCDSIITINLTVYIVDTAVSVNENTLVANVSPAVYQWLDCQDDYAEIPGATGQSFTPSESGSYAVRIVQNECVGTSFCHTVHITSINNIEPVSDFTIYPNPTNGDLYIDLGMVKQYVRLSIYDISGRKIKESIFQDKQSVLFDLNAEAGLYFLHIKTESGRSVAKIVRM
ncbi:T9SS type A sorting domain-containing protein [Bacteroidales bacterium OttesenSCG-928-B11]|nr:T9SS type A sorting domain-containing protein [Bacteroidales bacterium OttesenSCG-928-C03]MDL2313235.1 T9SS type A sorting domain-containing protein [Bacteroidales bacterium OttesenSCG-928-B11]